MVDPYGYILGVLDGKDDETAARDSERRARHDEYVQLDAKPHGVASTYSSGCKCGPCKRAWAAYIANWRASKRAA